MDFEFICYIISIVDLKDYQAGHSEISFGFRGKKLLINELMKKACKKNRNLKILNIGAGTGDDLDILNKFGENHLVDIEKEALPLIKKGICASKTVADACALPFENSSFDVVVSFDVFEHIPNDNKALQEIYRVLKKDGKLVFSVPAFQTLFSSHDKALHHVRRYNIKNLNQLLSSFKTKKLFYWNSLLFLPLAITRLKNRNAEPKIDSPLPKQLNALFFHLLNFDNFLIKHNLSMPIGISIVGICQK